ncbi:hypothetical protein F4824DRAFT_156075 [Ustulina deusta]|nr:hypothetical protein F4824DRAFT_156075 [Ustulina deusta]
MVNPMDPHDVSEVWHATEDNLKKFTTAMNDFVSKTTESITKMAMKHALFGGPIEGHTAQLMHDCMTRAGLSDAQQRDGTIKNACWALLKSEHYQNYIDQRVDKLIDNFITQSYQKKKNTIGKWMKDTECDGQNVRHEILNLEGLINEMGTTIRNQEARIRRLERNLSQSPHRQSGSSRPDRSPHRENRSSRRDRSPHRQTGSSHRDRSPDRRIPEPRRTQSVSPYHPINIFDGAYD